MRESLLYDEENSPQYFDIDERAKKFGMPEALARDRVITRAERYDLVKEDIIKSSEESTDPKSLAKKPGTNTPIKRKIVPLGHGLQTYPLPANVQGKTPKVDKVTREIYNATDNREIASLILAKFNRDHAALERNFNNRFTDSHQRMSSDEVEHLMDTSLLMQKDANEFYHDHAHLLNKGFEKPSYMPKQHKRFFDGETVTPPVKKAAVVDTEAAKENAPLFPYGQRAVLQNLKTLECLNDCPVRVLSFDPTTGKYTINIATVQAKQELRGYWLCSENHLRALDKPKVQESGPATVGNCDYADIGIDAESGQPTLDPKERPVHRQFGTTYSQALKERIRLLIEKYKEIFGTDIRTPCKFAPMKIELIPNQKLPRSPRFWKNSPTMREEVRTQLQKMLNAGVVGASNTAIVSNVLLVKRPGMPGKYRFTIDFRDLNAATVPQKWQMPDVQNQLDRLKGNKIFGALDISQYYHQIELHKESRYLTGFITEDGVFEYRRVPMGLTNACSHAQAELQKAIDADVTLAKYNVRNYFDDIPIAAKNEDDFMEVLEALFSLCKRMNLKVNEEKSVFGVTSITHVGFIVDANGVRVDPMRTQSFRELQTPTSIKKVQAVLGAMNYVRHFIPNFSTRAMPLTSMLGKKGLDKAKFIWSEACQKAFDDLKDCVLNTTPLAFIDYKKEIFIRCDSSQFGAGAVLFQFDEDGRELPIAYASRKYTLAERNYNTFQQEAAVIVWSLEKFSEYFQGHPVTVQSDHKNLSWVKRSAMPQLSRWRVRLQDFDFKIEYIPGPANICADGLSRLEIDDKDMLISMRDFLPTHAATESLLNSNIPIRQLSEFVGRPTRRYGDGMSLRSKTASEKIWESDRMNEEDVEVEGMVPHTSLESKVDDTDSAETTHVFDESGECIQEREVMDPIVQQPDLPDIDVLDGHVSDIIAGAHNDIVGHAGVYVTLQRVLRSEKGWADRQRMIRDIDAFLSGCPTCQKFRKRRSVDGAHRFVIQGSPFAEISVDILKLPRKDCRQNQYVVVIVDNFSRWTSCVAVQDKTAESAARAIIQTIGIFGCPLRIRSDGGGEFINDILKSVEELLGTKHHKITPYLHTGNSLAEKANRAVLENLRNIIFDSRLRLHGEHQWSDILPLAQRIINASFNSSIGCSPAQIIFGDNIDMDRCLVTPTKTAASYDTDAYVAQLLHNQSIIIDAADKHLHETQAKNLRKWKATHKSDLKIDAAMRDGAWVLARYADDAPKSKLKPKWRGPFRLLDWKNETHSIVRLQDTVKNKVIETHINDVELWNPLFESSVEGLTKVAEFDNWSYPIDAILGIALDPKDDDVEPVALPLDAPRCVAQKKRYLFSVKWKNYNEPSWVPYNDIKGTSSFELFAAMHSALNL